MAARREPPIDADVWELHAPDDWTQANDLAHEQPGKLAQLQRLFLIEAARYLDGDKVGEGRVEHTVPMLFSGTRRPTSVATVPLPSATTMGPTTPSPAASPCQIDIDEAAEDADHLISPDELLRVAMARQ